MTINYILLTILVRAVAVLDSVVPVEVIGPRQLMSAQYDFFYFVCAGSSIGLLYAVLHC